MVDDNATLNDVTERIGEFLTATRRTGRASIASAAAVDDVTEAMKRPPILEVSRYEVGEIIGEGGMGRVLLAHDRALERAVAVKTLHARDDDNKKKFVRECAIAGRLEHPNIVPLYDAGVDDDGRPYLAMRYIRGQNLRSVIEGLRANDPEMIKRFSLEARSRIVLQLLSALDLAHSRRVLHRDIKPENVMLGPFGEVLLVDWGIACSPEESAADADKHLGTLKYMSPEQVDGVPLDERSDIYSLSVLAYELLTLKHPLDDVDKSESARVAAILKKPTLSAEHVRVHGHPVVPRALSLVLDKGLAKDRDARWPSASAMQRAIEVVLAGDAPVVCPHTAYQRGLTSVGRFLDRFPRVTFFATFATLAFALVGLVSTVAFFADLAGFAGFASL